MSRDPLKFGGTAAAAIMCAEDGEDYYSSPWDVYARVKGIPTKPTPVFFETGLTLEPVLLDWWQRSYGDGYELQRAPVISLDWQTAHLDGLAVRIDGDEAIVVDPKMSMQEHVWRVWDVEEGRFISIIQPGYVWQLTWYARMAEEVIGVRVTRLDFPIWVCARTAAGKSPYMIRSLPYDDFRREEAARQLAAVTAWRERFVLGGEVPEFDGGEAAAGWLAKEMGPAPKKRGLAYAAPALVDLVHRWRYLTIHSATMAGQAKAIGQTILHHLGPNRLYVGGRTKGPFVQGQVSTGGGAYLKGYNFESSTDDPLDI